MISERWGRPNELWHQRTVYAEAGEPIITYHFKSQAESPSKVFEIETKLTRQLCGYELLKKDLSDIRMFLEELKDVLATEGLRHRTNLQKSIVRSIVITYGKCFAKADGRKIKLERRVVPTEFIKLNDYVMNMRHNFVAHAGESRHESCKYVLVIPPLTSIKYAENVQYASFVETHQAVNDEVIFNENFDDLLGKLLVFVNDKIFSLEKDVLSELKIKLKKSFSRLYDIETDKNRSVLKE